MWCYVIVVYMYKSVYGPICGVGLIVFVNSLFNEFPICFAVVAVVCWT